MIVKKNTLLAGLVILFLIAIVLLTNYYGSTDIGDYTDVAKFFANDYSAPIRSSHSYLMGFLLAPFLNFLNSFIIFKLISLIFLGLIVYSVYLISNKNPRALLLILLSPVVWYMAPWASPIQIASLLLLWAYYFIEKYDRYEKIKYLLYSAMLIGLSLAFWDTMIYFGLILAFCYLFNKKFYSFFLFLVFMSIGLLPRLALDQYLFNFPFLTLIKTFVSGFISILNKGIYSGAGYVSYGFLPFLLILLAIPFYYWKLYTPKLFIKNKKAMLFLTLSILLILSNPQIRYTLAIIPIITLLLMKNLRENRINKQIWILLPLLILFFSPVVLQLGYTSASQPYGLDILSLANKADLSSNGLSEKIIQDLDKISVDYPNQTFLVGNNPDDYQILAHYYWGKNINEFVSIQDYQLSLNNQTTIFEKKLSSSSNINDRRQIWIAGGIDKNPNDKTDYNNLTLAIGLGTPIDAEGFNLVKNYSVLYISEKN